MGGHRAVSSQHKRRSSCDARSACSASAAAAAEAGAAEAGVAEAGVAEAASGWRRELSSIWRTWLGLG